MWMPPWIAKTVQFLCVKGVENNEPIYGGTAFFAQIADPACPDLNWDYLVTAKHCVEQAFDQYGNLHCRFNTKDGGSLLRRLPHRSSAEWIFSETADVAVLQMPFENSGEDVLSCPMEVFAGNDVIEKEGIGMGDDVFIVGLFTFLHGSKRNIPIMRSGIVACIPDEPLRDENSGESYRGFLIEARSIGGLSGSPVFMALKNRGRMQPEPRGFHPWTHTLLLFGLIRGHWDFRNTDIVSEFGSKEERLNVGITIVTPADEIAAVLLGDELKKKRRADVHAYKRQASRQ